MGAPELGVSVCLSGWWLFRLPLASAPPAALPPCRPADDDRGAGGLRQVLAPPRHPGGDAEALGGRLLEQVLCAPSGLRQWKDSGQVGSPPCSRSQCRVRHACVECVPQALSETSYFLLLLPSLALAFTLCQGLPWWLRWQRICLCCAKHSVYNENPMESRSYSYKIHFSDEETEAQRAQVTCHKSYGEARADV